MVKNAKALYDMLSKNISVDILNNGIECQNPGSNIRLEFVKYIDPLTNEQEICGVSVITTYNYLGRVTRIRPSTSVEFVMVIRSINPIISEPKILDFWKTKKQEEKL